jgi:hypothetical protein
MGTLIKRKLDFRAAVSQRKPPIEGGAAVPNWPSFPIVPGYPRPACQVAPFLIRL